MIIQFLFFCLDRWVLLQNQLLLLHYEWRAGRAPLHPPAEAEAEAESSQDDVELLHETVCLICAVS